MTPFYADESVQLFMGDCREVVEWLMGWPDGWVTDLVDNTAAPATLRQRRCSAAGRRRVTEHCWPTWRWSVPHDRRQDAARNVPGVCPNYRADGRRNVSQDRAGAAMREWLDRQAPRKDGET